MYRILGIERTEASPGPETLLKLVHPDDREKFLEQRARELRGERTTPIEYRIVRPDGAERIVRRESATVYDPGNQPVRRYGTLQDITDLRLAEQRERELERHLLHSQKLEALGTLAGGIAHDLNNSLTPIMALSKLTARRLEPGNPLRANLETIFAASEQARDLVKRVLAFSRRDKIDKKPTNLRAIIDDALKLLRATIPTSIRLDTQIGEVPAILADPLQIHQVITNLVSNAAQAIGGTRGVITVALDLVSGSGPKETIKLSVSDTGKGMDETTQRRIFEPFFTTKQVGQGTGLGLSIIERIVADHGGRIEVVSSPGNGARFDIYFPLLDAGASAAA
jgi:PAS domain S-box-containing protein